MFELERIGGDGFGDICCTVGSVILSWFLKWKIRVPLLHFASASWMIA